MSALIIRIFSRLSALSMAFLYILWVLLNGALVLGLLAGWYRCLQLFARQYSRSASIALCVMTLMTCTRGSGSLRESAPPRQTTITSSELTLDQPVYDDRNLLDLPLTRLSQRIQLYPTSQSSDSVRVDQSVMLSGLQLGLRWQPIDLLVSPRPNRRIRYDVSGILEWRLLSTTIYRQPVQYAGLLAVDSLPSRR